MEHGGPNRFFATALFQSCLGSVHHFDGSKFLAAGLWPAHAYPNGSGSVGCWTLLHGTRLLADAQVLQDARLVGFGYADDWLPLYGNDLDVGGPALAWEGLSMEGQSLLERGVRKSNVSEYFSASRTPLFSG